MDAPGPAHSSIYQPKAGQWETLNRCPIYRHAVHRIIRRPVYVSGDLGLLFSVVYTRRWHRRYPVGVAYNSNRCNTGNPGCSASRHFVARHGCPSHHTPKKGNRGIGTPAPLVNVSPTEIFRFLNCKIIYKMNDVSPCHGCDMRMISKLFRVWLITTGGGKISFLPS
jgi:hypothetical protein